MATSRRRRVVLGIDGGTESIRAGLFDPTTGTPVSEFAAAPYTTFFPSSGRAEQCPEEWYTAMVSAVRTCLQNYKQAKNDNIHPGTTPEIHVVGLSITTTCCTVVASDSNGKSLMNAIMWMDLRASDVVQQVLDTKDDALRVNSGGHGPVSSEWMIPKSLWLKKNLPHIYHDAPVICEYQDYINYRLTGTWCASINNISIRWHYDSKRTATDGWPISLLEKLDLLDLLPKWPKKVLPLGAPVGHGLCEQAAKDLGLDLGTPVAQGGADAFVGMVGLGVVNPRDMALLTGSSHLHLGLTDPDANPTGKGMWGAYHDAVIPGLGTVEGGQTSTGSAIAWFKKSILNDTVSYEQLNQEAQEVPIGCDGLVVNDHFMGNRTPFTDGKSRGALAGITLSHSRGHIFRALMESICFGTELVLEAMKKAGFVPNSIAVAGGAARSPLFLQIHADVSNIPLRITRVTEACLLGSAILAAVGARIYPSIQEAVAAMVHVEREIVPNATNHDLYKHVLERYRMIYPALRPFFYKATATSTTEHAMRNTGPQATGDSQPTIGNMNDIPPPLSTRAKRQGIISASILNADLSDLKTQVSCALEAGADQIHVDVVDNRFAKVLTFGAPVVASLRKRFGPHLFLDVHLAVDDPGLYIEQFAKAGASQILFHIESFVDSDRQKSLDLVAAIHERGIRAGIVLNPETRVEKIWHLLDRVDTVNILAVNPGFGGQKFNETVVDKIREVRKLKPGLDLMIDGGVNNKTAEAAVSAGCNVIVSGTYIFSADDMKERVGALRRALEKAS